MIEEEFDYTIVLFHTVEWQFKLAVWFDLFQFNFVCFS